MTTKEYIESLKYKEMTGEQTKCPRCGGDLSPVLAENALSRYADVYICSECGTDEATRDAVSTPQPLESWVSAELQYIRARKKLYQNERKPLASPDSFSKYVSDVERQYEKMKEKGTCPYSSLREYMESLLYTDVAEQYKKKHKKESEEN